MDIQDVRTVRRECEATIVELLVELERKTGTFVQYFEFERVETMSGDTGPIGKVSINLGLDES